MPMIKTNQRGFTIVELMIATAAFSLILLIATGAIVEIGKLYYKTIIQSKTQETARNISEEVTRSFQFSRAAKEVPNPLVNQFCIGDTRYTYQFNQKVDPSATPGNVGIRVSRIAPTDTCSFPGSPGDELLGKNMRLLDFEVTPHPGTGNEVYQIRIRIAYGENELLTHYDNSGSPIAGPPDAYKTALCKSNIAGSNFCAVSHLDNIVKKRLQ